jgi:hypothetical protein
MSVTTYAELKTTVANYLARTDLTDQIADFIRFAELRLRREVRIRQILKSTTISTTSGTSTVNIPSDFLEVRDFIVNTNPVQPLTYSSPSTFSRNSRTTESGKPLDYTILATQFQLAPIPDSVYSLKLLHYFTPTYLSDSNTSNEFLVNVPDLLLYATLLEAEPYLMNDARVSTWGAMYEKGLAALTKSDESAQYSGVPLAVKVV